MTSLPYDVITLCHNVMMSLHFNFIMLCYHCCMMLCYIMTSIHYIMMYLCYDMLSLHFDVKITLGNDVLHYDIITL